MKKLIYIALPFLWISCQIEDENAPKPEDSFIKYYGSLAEQEAKDLEPIWNADSTDIEGFVMFGTQQKEGEDVNYFVALADASGNLIASNSFGFQRDLDGRDLDGDLVADTVFLDESAGQIEVLPGGGFAVIGTSTLNFPAADIVDLKFITYAFLDANLELVGRVRQIGDIPNEFDYLGNDIVRLSDGTLLLIGARETISDFDFYIRKITPRALPDPDLIHWEKVYGLVSGGLDDFLIRGFENNSQNLVLFGYSDDVGENGELGTNVTVLELNQNGNPAGAGSNSIGITDQLPLIFSDVLTDVIEKPGGYLAVGTSTVNEETFAFFMDIDQNGSSNLKDTLVSEFTFNGTSIQSAALGVTASATNDFIVVGQYPSFRTDDANRRAEAMFMRINQVGEKVQGFESNYGIGDGNDTAVDALELPDGKIVVLCTIDFGGAVKMMSLIKLNDTGELDR